jgi:predicted dehydrogenase
VRSAKTRSSSSVEAPLISRRSALKSGLAVSGGLLATARLAGAAQRIELPPLLGPSEVEGGSPRDLVPPDERVGFAIVGLGHLALTQVLPAFGESRLARPVALVSGHRAKAETVASQYGIDRRSIYSYEDYDRLRDDPKIAAVYIALPNAMHADYSVRAARAGKHVLCEKPMATSVEDCRRMIAASEQARTKLMIAYRMQYEPYNREIIRLARAGELGTLRSFAGTNGQVAGDPRQWRLKKSLAGGGSLMDLGIYCLNAARFLSGEEPTRVFAVASSTPHDPRFTEVEEQLDFVLRFPSGFVATATSSYGLHDSKRFRLMGASGWADLDPAFPYHGQTLRLGHKVKGAEADVVEDRRLEAKNQFALELDHFASCIKHDRVPHTPGEEGMQDVRVMTALYQSASAGHPIDLPTVTRVDAYRGPSPET